MDDRISRGSGHLENLKSRAFYLLKDSLKIARLALVDISTSELMTEDATNTDEWGPTTKQMAEISKVIFNSEDYLRVVQILHNRLALNPKKHWKQVHKTLILLEYLLGHGPEHLVMEFREEKDRLEELTRFVYVDWKGSDRSSALQTKAKHVLHLLTNEAAYREERIQAQKTSQGICGFGSQSRQQKSAHVEYDPHIFGPRSKSTSCLMTISSAEDSRSLLVDEDHRYSSCKLDTKKTSTHSNSVGDESEADMSSPCFSETTWGTSSSSSRGESLSARGRSVSYSSSDGNRNEESPTSNFSFRRTAQILDMDSVASELETTVVDDLPLVHTSPPMSGYKSVVPKLPAHRRPVISKAEDLASERSSAPVQKLPPPPPMAEYKPVIARPPQSGSRVSRRQIDTLTSAREPTVDLISI
ncbi:uncharacterized protein [Physcomitrium patens]|uniref:ENTH domain-containing protein n=2 Tax=Physcomitrium patens TaxID=3218 RepID=A0A2K1JXA0_PHYPA|nr:epsin-3-like isoform X1 [Physcomitrium patens]PNR46148.1 hypothetical protein PHYPA_013267 [Physcomitrium patens]|eukprot:XP_024386448.1 epsin-3-like isoform X1 [Physcomitrella patens]